MRSAPGRRSSPSIGRRVAGRAEPGRVPRRRGLPARAAVRLPGAGGGENQLVQTGRHLEALGVRVRLFSPWTDRLESARLLHLFGMSREGLELARLARSRGVPVVLSPICWYQPRAIAALEPNLRAEGRRAWRPGACDRSRRASPRWRRELLQLADVVLPNSRAEADQLVASLRGRRETGSASCPTACCPSFGTASPEPFRERWGPDPFVLSVGRIEPRKNTLGLIRAVRRLGLPLVIIGEAVPGSERLRPGVPARRRGPRHLAGTARPRRSRCWPRPTRRPGSSRCRAGSRRPDWPRSRPPWRAAPSRSRRMARPANISATSWPTLGRIGPRRSAARSGPAGIDGPDPRLAPRVATHYLWPKVAQITAEVYDQVAR